jgi:PhnB protein
MKAILPYLNFDGTCHEAMTFYASCLGGDLAVHRFADMPGAPPEAKDRLMHARLANGAAELMASDILPGMPYQTGSNYSVSVHCDSREEIERIFAKFAAKGQVTMPLDDQFWGARFGMIKDQFGVHWMFNYEYPKQ